MAVLSIRHIVLTFSGKGGSITIASMGTDDALKVEFNVTKTMGSKQNTGTVEVWNLSKSNRNKLGEEFDKVTLEVGHRSSQTGIILKGNIRDVKHTLEDTSVKSTIEVGDGDEGINKGAVSETFKKGTKPRSIIDKLVEKMPGVEKGEMKGLDDLPETKRPVSMFGWAHRELDELGRQYGFYWSIQNGKFEAMKNDQYLGSPIVLSKETGLIGVPEVTDKGISAKAILNPQIAPGRLVDIRSQFLDEESGRDKKKSDAGGGLFRVSSCTYSGTNRGNDYYVDLEGTRVQGNKVVK